MNFLAFKKEYNLCQSCQSTMEIHKEINYVEKS